MKNWHWYLSCGALLATAACSKSDSPKVAMAGELSVFQRFEAKAVAALGTFDDIEVFRPRDDGSWELVAGQFVPVTVDGKVPTHFTHDMRSDRPMMLPTRVQGFTGGDGQSSPYSVVGRMPGSNPEVQWVFVVRKYEMMAENDPAMNTSGDIAVIGHHPRTGASIFLQFYDPDQPKPAQKVVSLTSPGADQFWSPIQTIADSFECQRCHTVDPFIHTPWINQVRVDPDDPASEAMVPSNPLGPYFFVDADGDDTFSSWNKMLLAPGGGHLVQPTNVCTECHRIGADMIGLSINSTRYHGLSDVAPHNDQNGDPTDPVTWSLYSDQFETEQYHQMHWMPPVGKAAANATYTDFFAGQQAVAPFWDETNGASATEVNEAVASPAGWSKAYQAGKIRDVPRPPAQYEAILVDRPEQDEIAAGQSLWLIDTRMRANTDADLAQWSFVGKGPVDAAVEVAPVVYRRVPGNGSQIEYEVVFVGQPRNGSVAGRFVPVRDEADFDLKLGDVLGVVFTNKGTAAARAMIPYTDDDWAKLQLPDGTLSLREGSVTYRMTDTAAPAVGKQIQFGDAAYRTYSFEFKNRLASGR